MCLAGGSGAFPSRVSNSFVRASERSLIPVPFAPQVSPTRRRCWPTSARRRPEARQRRRAFASSGLSTTPVRPPRCISPACQQLTFGATRTEQASWVEETLDEARAWAAEANLTFAVDLYVTRPSQQSSTLPTLARSGGATPTTATDSPSLADTDDEKKLDLSPAGSTDALGSACAAAARCNRFSGRPDIALEVAKMVRESTGRTIVVGARRFSRLEQEDNADPRLAASLQRAAPCSSPRTCAALSRGMSRLSSHTTSPNSTGSWAPACRAGRLESRGRQAQGSAGRSSV